MSVDRAQPQVEMACTKKSQQDRNFSIEEDKLLVSSWLSVGMDAVQGTDQIHQQFWQRVHAYFHEHREFPSERGYNSLMNRWSIIQQLTNKFCEILTQIEGLHQSGITEQDKIDKAKSMYHKVQNAYFPFEHCWHLLKDKPKWLQHGPKEKQRRSSMAISANLTHTSNSANEGEGDNFSHDNNVNFDRPIGRKAEKVKRKRKKGLSEDIVEFMKKRMESLEEARILGETIIRLEKEKLRLKKKKLHLQELDRKERIMMIDTRKMSGVQQEYWKARQKKILESQDSSK